MDIFTIAFFALMVFYYIMEVLLEKKRVYTQEEIDFWKKSYPHLFKDK